MKTSDDQHTGVTVKVDALIQPPIDVVMDDQEKMFKTELRQSLGTAEYGDDIEASFSIPSSGGLWVEFDDGPTVKFDMGALFAAALTAAEQEGYYDLEDDDDA